MRLDVLELACILVASGNSYRFGRRTRAAAGLLFPPNLDGCNCIPKQLFKSKGSAVCLLFKIIVLLRVERGHNMPAPEFGHQCGTGEEMQ